MKKSLQQAITVFPLHEKLLLFFFLLLRKLGKFPVEHATKFFAECEQYVHLIEKGVTIKRKSNRILQLSYCVNSKPYIFLIRRKGSDIRAFETVILQEEYKSSKDQLVLNENNQPHIIDAGGNVGFATIYLHAFFPAASFIILEPDAENYLMLEQNMTANRIANATLLQNALWINEDELFIDDSFRDGLEWSLTVSSTNEISPSAAQKNINGVTLDSLCERSKNKNIDLLKIDVEGAERFLFTNQTFINTLHSHVESLVIEIHDEFEIRPLIYNIMQNGGYKIQEYCDVTLFYKIENFRTKSLFL